MRTTFFLAAIFASALALATGRAQAPGAQTPLQRLQEISRKNKLLIETQTATLKKLEDLEQLSQQLKFFGRRT